MAKRRRKKYRAKLRFYFIVLLFILVTVESTKFFFNLNQNLGLPYEQGRKIATAARFYIANKDLVYDPAYFEGGYPPDNLGVCTDVIWEGLLQGIAMEIKPLVDADIAFRPEAYKEILDVVDPNIDFRRVDVLEVFMNGNTEVQDRSPKNLLAWMPGDFVTFEHGHIAIVSELTNIWGRPYIIQHGKDPAGEEDRLIATDGMEISGHYRWPLQKDK